MSHGLYAWNSRLPGKPLHHNRPKLTPAQRDEIVRRKTDGESAKTLSLEYGVSVRYIYSL